MVPLVGMELDPYQNPVSFDASRLVIRKTRWPCFLILECPFRPIEFVDKKDIPGLVLLNFSYRFGKERVRGPSHVRVKRATNKTIG